MPRDGWSWRPGRLNSPSTEPPVAPMPVVPLDHTNLNLRSTPSTLKQTTEGLRGERGDAVGKGRSTVETVSLRVATAVSSATKAGLSCDGTGQGLQGVCGWWGHVRVILERRVFVILRVQGSLGVVRSPSSFG